MFENKGKQKGCLGNLKVVLTGKENGLRLWAFYENFLF